MEYLHDTIKKQAYDHSITKPKIPQYILNNLRYNFFDWQAESFKSLITFEAIKEETDDRSPVHLMFNMATGTGKTLVMAGCILHYYKKGYRKFIFFVNQNNVVDKTENNFIDSNHNKYLFTDEIVIDDETVTIKKVETFSNNDDVIEIKLTTIQKLYNDIHIQKENQVLLDDLIKQDIVMLADEAHHLNTDTKRLQGELDLHIELKDNANKNDVERKGWEHTVIELLLNKNGKEKNNQNVLLEFTATIPRNQNVVKKYAPKTIYKFGLKEFLSAGYTKEINLLYSNLDKKERMLQAILFSWYRHKIALKNDLVNWKPVVLFRSKTIAESKIDFNEFLLMVKNLKTSDFSFLENIEEQFFQKENSCEQGKSRVMDLIAFIENEEINKFEIVSFIQDNFVARNCIITNSKTNQAKIKENIDEDVNKLLNNLEDKDNHIRAIFTVNRLTEGWDVLNLFDIVRLYEGRDEGKDSHGNRIAGSATVSETQLIGRGVRYYPFSYQDKIKNKRKFDKNLNNEMRVLEELYYHSDSDHKYIDELKRELKNQGLISDGRTEKRFNLKKCFVESEFFKNAKIWKNEQISNPNRKRKTLDYFKKTSDFDLVFNLASLGIKEEEIDFDSEISDTSRLNLDVVNKGTLSVKIKDFEKHIFNKAVNIKSKKQSSPLRFESLRKEFSINSVDDFRIKQIGGFEIQIITAKNSFEEVTNKEKLEVLLEFLDRLFEGLKKYVRPHSGTEFKAYSLSKFFSEEVRKNVEQDEHSQELEEELKDKDWYVVEQFHGTSEERELIEFIKGTIRNLQEKYKAVYLLRNEKQYKIYDFDTGIGFQPDFILFLKDKIDLHYQVFIEPKGDHLVDKDKWKNEFLKEIAKKYSNGKMLKAEGENYNLIGLPFFNQNNNKEFKKEYRKLTD